MTTHELDTLKSVMDKTAVLIDSIEPGQLTAGTPCTEWDVDRLARHLTGWAENFADRAEGSEPAENPDDIPLGDEPAARFRSAEGRLLAALAADGEHPEKSPQPDILIAEYVLHGSDLARGLGQQPPFTDQEAEPGLVAMRGMLKPEYRGYGFENEVEVSEDAGTVAKLLAFSGRQP